MIAALPATKQKKIRLAPTNDTSEQKKTDHIASHYYFIYSHAHKQKKQLLTAHVKCSVQQFRYLGFRHNWMLGIADHASCTIY